jgi:hypothetical protein
MSDVVEFDENCRTIIIEAERWRDSSNTNSMRWRFIDLARSHHISPGALYHRLERFGETATGIARALATGIMSREQAGKRGKENNRLLLQSRVLQRLIRLHIL